MKKTHLLALVSMSLLISAPAFADAGGWFVGGDVGRSSYSDAALTQSNATSVDLNLGYNYNKNLGVEVAYADLGRVYVGAVPVKAKEASMSALVAYPINGSNFGLYGRLGYGVADLNTGNTSARHDGLIYGAGVSYRLNDNYSLRAGVNRYPLHLPFS